MIVDCQCYSRNLFRLFSVSRGSLDREILSLWIRNHKFLANYYHPLYKSVDMLHCSNHPRFSHQEKEQFDPKMIVDCQRYSRTLFLFVVDSMTQLGVVG